MLSLKEAVEKRRSTRAFLDKPVKKELLDAILQNASRSPSGGNLQPWTIYVLTGNVLSELKEKVADRLRSGDRDVPEYMIHPKPLKEPFRSRSFKCGEDLYRSIGIAREDKPGRLRQFGANYNFFGAPVGLIFAIDRSFGHAQYVHLGMFMQTVMLVAEDADLGTCAQEIWADMHKTISEGLYMPPELMVYCGMALGYPDLAHPINSYFTERASVSKFATFCGF